MSVSIIIYVHASNIPEIHQVGSIAHALGIVTSSIAHLIFDGWTGQVFHKDHDYNGPYPINGPEVQTIATFGMDSTIKSSQMRIPCNYNGQILMKLQVEILAFCMSESSLQGTNCPSESSPTTSPTTLKTTPPILCCVLG